MKACCSELFAVHEPDSLVACRRMRRACGFNGLCGGITIPGSHDTNHVGFVKITCVKFRVTTRYQLRERELEVVVLRTEYCRSGVRTTLVLANFQKSSCRVQNRAFEVVPAFSTLKRVTHKHCVDTSRGTPSQGFVLLSADQCRQRTSRQLRRKIVPWLNSVLTHMHYLFLCALHQDRR